MKSVFLHVGNFKTGTTSIQEFCHKNRQTLLAAGTCYLSTARPLTNPNNHSRLSLSLYQKLGGTAPEWYSHADSFENVAQSVRQEMVDTAADRFIISSEEFYRLAETAPESRKLATELLNKLFAGFRVNVIMYVREPLPMLKSWYNQINKENVPRCRFIDFVSAVDPNIADPTGNTQFWSNCFGEASLTIEKYELEGSEHIARFIQLTETPTTSLEALFAVNLKLNERLPESGLEKIRLQRILGQTNREQQSKLLRCDTFSSIEKIKNLEHKLHQINVKYTQFCEQFRFSDTSEKLTLHALLLHEEKTHPGDAILDVIQLPASQPWRHRMKSRTKKWFRSLHRWISKI